MEVVNQSVSAGDMGVGKKVMRVVRDSISVPREDEVKGRCKKTAHKCTASVCV